MRESRRLNMLLTRLFIVILVVMTLVQAEDDCYATNENPYLLFATRTGYLNTQLEQQDLPITPPQGCRLSKFWLLSRHGSRHPNDDDLLEMEEKAEAMRDVIMDNLEAGQASLCDLDVLAFRNWHFNLTLEDATQLTELGALEMELLALNFKRRLQDLLDDNFDGDKFTFRHTDKSRTADSALNYATATFPGQQVHIPEALDEDPLLEFFDFCSNWVTEVDKNESAIIEQTLFDESLVMQQTVRNVNRRLGFTNSQFDLKAIKLMYDLCRFEEISQIDIVSTWCAVFLEEDLQVMEYSEDLKYFYVNGYGHEINGEMACPLFSDAFTFLTNTSDTSVARFYFSHSDALLSLLTLLNLYEDQEPLRHDNFHTMKDRVYRSSLIGPNASNMAFVGMECELSPHTRFVALHQERIVRLQGCQEDVCDLEAFVQANEDKIVCHFDALCNHD